MTVKGLLALTHGLKARWVGEHWWRAPAGGVKCLNEGQKVLFLQALLWACEKTGPFVKGHLTCRFKLKNTEGTCGHRAGAHLDFRVGTRTGRM